MMKRLLAFLLGVPCAAFLLSGCSAKAPVKGKGPTDFESSLAALSVPLDIQDYRIVSSDGHRGVFLKLTRLPDAIEEQSEKNPPQIIIEIKGPTGAEAPEQEFPGLDTLVTRVRVARYFGVLRVTLDLQGEDLPDYTVHQMADWIMIRLPPEAPGLFSPIKPPS